MIPYLKRELVIKNTKKMSVFSVKELRHALKYFILLFDVAKYKFVFSKYKNNYQVTKNNIS